jgi:hypothetical protein
MAVGAATSIAVPRGGVSQVVPEIVEGLGLLSAEHDREGTAPAPAPTPRRPTRSAWTWAAAGAIGLALIVFGLYLSERDGTTKQTPPAAASTAMAPSAPPTAGGAIVETETTPASTAAAPPAPTTRSRSARGREPRCPESSPGRRDVHERGRLEARDELNAVTYAFAICEERDIATSAVVMRIVSSNTTGTIWSSEAATRKAEDMERRAESCAPTGSPAVRSSGPNDPRHIVYVLCQHGGKPTSLEIHATTRKADGSAFPPKVLRAVWPPLAPAIPAVSPPPG